jgi:hypothetical protein
MNSMLVPADRIATSALVLAATKNMKNSRRLARTHKLPAIVQMLKLLTASLVTNVVNMLAVLTLARITFSSERERIEKLNSWN